MLKSYFKGIYKGRKKSPWLLQRNLRNDFEFKERLPLILFNEETRYCDHLEAHENLVDVVFSKMEKRLRFLRFVRVNVVVRQAKTMRRTFLGLKKDAV